MNPSQIANTLKNLFLYFFAECTFESLWHFGIIIFPLVFYLSFPLFIVLFILCSISLSHTLLYFSSCFPSLFPTLYCTVLQFDISAVLFFLCRVIGIGNAKRSSRNVLQILVKLLYFLVSVLIFPRKNWPLKTNG